ncbi:hypothetical protein K466DRAFT_570100, partial [Polyporus arcularius HHB13444]
VATLDVLRSPDRENPFVLVQPQPRLQDILPSVDLTSAAKHQRLPNLDAAYVGLVEETGSLFAMSPDRYPLVVFGDSNEDNARHWRSIDPPPGSVFDPTYDYDKDFPADVDSVTRIAKAKRLREMCKNGATNVRCLTGVDSQSRLSRMVYTLRSTAWRVEGLRFCHGRRGRAWDSTKRAHAGHAVRPQKVAVYPVQAVSHWVVTGCIHRSALPSLRAPQDSGSRHETSGDEASMKLLRRHTNLTCFLAPPAARCPGVYSRRCVEAVPPKECLLVPRDCSERDCDPVEVKECSVELVPSGRRLRNVGLAIAERGMILHTKPKRSADKAIREMDRLSVSDRKSDMSMQKEDGSRGDVDKMSAAQAGKGLWDRVRRNDDGSGENDGGRGQREKDGQHPYRGLM